MVVLVQNMQGNFYASSLQRHVYRWKMCKYYFNEMNIGIMGEISPLTVQNFKLRVPVAAFELNISSFLKNVLEMIEEGS